MQTMSAILQVWDALQSRYHEMVSKLSDKDLELRIGAATIGYMLRHSAEVEYMFAEWFFGCPIPEKVKIYTSQGPARYEQSEESLSELIALLEASNYHIQAAMQALPEEAWSISVSSPMGESTPIEAIGRLMYHNGMHAGQISLIRKHGLPEKHLE